MCTFSSALNTALPFLSASAVHSFVEPLQSARITSIPRSREDWQSLKDDITLGNLTPDVFNDWHSYSSWSVFTRNWFSTTEFKALPSRASSICFFIYQAVQFRWACSCHASGHPSSDVRSEDRELSDYSPQVACFYWFFRNFNPYGDHYHLTDFDTKRSRVLFFRSLLVDLRLLSEDDLPVSPHGSIDWFKTPYTFHCGLSNKAFQFPAILVSKYPSVLSRPDAEINNIENKARYRDNINGVQDSTKKSSAESEVNRRKRLNNKRKK